jgi:hypothetical protein
MDLTNVRVQWRSPISGLAIVTIHGEKESVEEAEVLAIASNQLNHI